MLLSLLGRLSIWLCPHNLSKKITATRNYILSRRLIS